MPKLTGSYNEYGYVIRKNSRVIYAAGNSPSESQIYIGIREFKKDTYHTDGRRYRKGHLLREPIPEDANVYSLEVIGTLCANALTDMCDRPELYGLKGEYEAGKASYSKNLNPLEEAYKCGALTR